MIKLEIDLRFKSLHDFLLAKEIIDETLRIIKENPEFSGLEDIKSVNIEIGLISLAHDGHPEHTEDISIESLQFGLQSIAKNTILKDTEFIIKKVEGDSWKITNIKV